MAKPGPRCRALVEPVVSAMDPIQMASAVAASVVAWSLGNALMVGIASVVAGVAARLLRGRWGVLLVAAGSAFSGAVALGMYQATGDLYLPILLLLVGVLATVLVGHLLRDVPMIGSVMFLAAGWYLVIYAFLGPFVRTSILGDLALAGLILGSALLVHHSARVIENRRPAQSSMYLQSE